MKRISIVVIGVLAVAVAVAQNENSESGYYSFAGGSLVAAYKAEYYPVLSGDRRGVYLDTDQGMKRVRYSADCRFFPKTVLTDQFVEISDTKFGFNNLRHARMETDAVAQMMQAEVGTETEILLRGGGIAGAPAGGLSQELQTQLDDLKTVQQENSEFLQESLEKDAYGPGVLSDIVDVKFNLLSETELENVFCVMGVRYLRRVSNVEEKFVRTGIVRMKKVGNFKPGKSKKVRFSFPLPEGYVNDQGIDLFLYTGDGEPLATNLSKELRPATEQEALLAAKRVTLE